MDRLEDNNLIEESKNGSREAFDALILKYHRRVFNVVYRLINNYEEANDIAQEVFVHAFRAIKGFRQESSVFTWLYRIAVNLSKNRLKALNRERKRLDSLDDPIVTEEGIIKKEIIEDRPSPSEVLSQKETGELIQGTLASLEPEFREVVVLRDMEGLSYEEIAKILKINVGTVKSRLHRARTLLKDKLKGVLR